MLKMSALIILLLSIIACVTPATNTVTDHLSTTPWPAITGTTGVPGVQVVSVYLDRSQQQNPGGPSVIILLKNIASDSIISLDMKLYEPNVPHGSPWTFDFNVSQAKPFVPGTALSYKNTLINGGWGTGIPYFVTVAGTYSNGTTFSFRWTPPGDGDFNPATIQQ